MYGNFENSLTVLTGKAGCVDCDTEFFNGHEWKRIADFKQGDKVLQYNDDGTAELVSPLVYVKSPCDKLWRFKTKCGLDQCLSDDHNVYYQTNDKRPMTNKFSEIRKIHESSKRGFSGQFYCSFEYGGKGVSLTDTEIRAFCITFIHQNGEYGSFCTAFSKMLAESWYDCTYRQLCVICDTLMLLRGYGNFITTSKEVADFIQFAFTATHRSANIYYYGGMYNVIISNRRMAIMTDTHGNKAKIEEYTTKDGFMYCFTVPSHKWVMRRNNKIVVTGNSGKSTWLNQFFIAEPLEAGERVLIYSGELPARILLGNILRPLASRRHIIELDNGENQPKGYKVTTEASKAIKSYYRDNLFVFDDLDELETSGGGLLEAMEYSYKRYGITSYVIDNLMTVDMRGVDGESKIDRQIQFVKRLKKFTREYPVKVLLVAHARKLASGQADTGLDDISGASEIVKLCDRCYDVKVLHNDDTEDALAPSTKISVIKDRQAGRVGAKFELYFDECSSRIYTDEPERDKQYAWERDLWRQKKEIQYPEVIKNHIVANLPDRTVPVKIETMDGEKPDDMPF